MSLAARIQEVEGGFIVNMDTAQYPGRTKVCNTWLEVFTELGIFFSAGKLAKSPKTYEDQCEKEDRGPCSLTTGRIRSGGF